MKLLLLLLSIIVLFINTSSGQIIPSKVTNCTNSLSKYFAKEGSYRVQLVVIRPNGEVVYVNNTLTTYTGFLTNGNDFPAVFSTKTNCTNGKVQFFDIAQKKSSFYDRSGIILWSDGRLYLSPLWAGENVLTWRVNLFCTGTASNSINYAWSSDGHLITLQFLE